MELWNYVNYVLMCNKCGGRTSRRRVFFWNPIWPGVRGESGRNERTGIPALLTGIRRVNIMAIMRRYSA